MGAAEQIGVLRSRLTLGARSLSILGYLSGASLIGILIASAILMAAYRHIAVTRFVELSQNDALALSQSLFNSLHREFRQYLGSETHHSLPPSDQLRAAIEDLRTNTHVDDVDIIDDEGIIVFATKAEHLGRKLAADSSLHRALEGRPASQIASIHWLWLGAHEAGEHRLRSYIPFRSPRTGRVIGVFVIIHDVTPLIAMIERTEIEVFLLSASIMLVLYVFMLAISRHAQTMAKDNEAKLQERSRRLTKLSQQLIDAEESDKERLAFELHEGIAQTLCALKLRIETTCGGASSRSGACTRFRQDIVPTFEDALQAVRALAEDIYPSSLSSLGLVRALDGHFYQFMRSYPGVHVEWVTSLTRVSASRFLETTLLRLVEDTTRFLASDSRLTRLRVELSRNAETLVLEIADDKPRARLLIPTHDEQQDPSSELHDRVALSGGSSHARSNPWGGTTFRAEWVTAQL